MVRPELRDFAVAAGLYGAGQAASEGVKGLSDVFSGGKIGNLVPTP